MVDNVSIQSRGWSEHKFGRRKSRNTMCGSIDNTFNKGDRFRPPARYAVIEYVCPKMSKNFFVRPFNDGVFLMTVRDDSRMPSDLKVRVDGFHKIIDKLLAVVVPSPES